MIMFCKKFLILTAALSWLLGAPISFAAEADCVECHDSAPYSADHMEVDEISVESCTMCHEAASDDLFFIAVHKQHAEEPGCEHCHADVDDARKTKLQELLPH